MPAERRLGHAADGDLEALEPLLALGRLVDAESAEYRQVLEAYQSIFAYRLGNWLGIEGNELIERLAKATVSGVGSEWNVPCAWRY